MERHVIVGYDGTERAERALDWATTEAGLRGRPLTITHAWHDAERDEDAKRLRREAEEVLAQAVERVRARAPGLAVTTDLYEGLPADRLVALSADADLVVLGSGAVSGGLVRVLAPQVRCPLIVVRGPARPPHAGPVTVGVRDPGDDEVLGFACHEAALRGLELTVVHTWRGRPAACGGSYAPDLDPADLRDTCEGDLDRSLAPWRAKYPDLSVETGATEGSPRQELLEATTDSTMLVVGAPPDRLGATAVYLLHNSRCPLAIVRREAHHGPS
jgi:nucleotide-binding universal stress UspA family protein